MIVSLVKLSKKLLARSAFAIPLFLLLALDVFILKRPYYVGQGDGTHSSFGLGLNVLTHAQLEGFHTPGYLIQGVLSAIWIFLSGGPYQESVKNFNTIGVIFFILCVVFVSIWLHKATEKFIKVFDLFILGLIFITMPTMFCYFRAWSLFPLPALLSLIICLGLAFPYLNEKIPFSKGWFFFILLGLVCANFFIGIALTIALFITIGVVFFKKDKTSFANYLGVSTSQSKTSLTLFFLCLAAFTYGLTKSTTLLSFFGLTLLLGIGIGTVFLFNKKFPLFIKGILTPWLIGWLLGANRRFASWFISLDSAFHDKGGAAQGGIPLSDIIFLPYLNSMSWFFIPFFTIIVIVFTLCFYQKKKVVIKTQYQLLFFVSLILVFGILLHIAVVGSITLKPQVTFGYSARYYVLCVGLVALLWFYTTLLLQPFRKLQGLFRIGITCLCLASTYQYIRWITPQIDYNQKAEQVVAQFFKKNLNGKVLCIRTTYTEPCTTLLAYQDFRTERSIEQVSVTSLNEDQYQYIDIDPLNPKFFEMVANSSKRLNNFAIDSRSYILITDSTLYLLKNFELKPLLSLLQI